MKDISVLKKINLLKDINDKNLEEIYNICRFKKYNTPTILFEYGSNTNFIFMIIKGKVEHLLPIQNERLIKFYVSEAGETIGLSSILPKEYRTLFTAKTFKGITEIIEIDRNELNELFQKNRSLGYIFIKQVLKVYYRKKTTQNKILISSLLNHPEIKKYIDS